MSLRSLTLINSTCYKLLYKVAYMDRLKQKLAFHLSLYNIFELQAELANKKFSSEPLNIYSSFSYKYNNYIIKKNNLNEFFWIKLAFFPSLIEFDNDIFIHQYPIYFQMSYRMDLAQQFHFPFYYIL